ncbi:DNA topoisomerase (ATP-hydrolyzing) subunit A [Chroococcus sp. FPU101]|uniref:DNA gyrase/topoisomerase IV subunit A n=1 Tax=Chroococcus sp. FPU101 TaxID=1974212 RepID=UPI001A8C39CE|nr:DNA topoisomerase (ATP-hydrolyzing) [Chroococcus sp. FPU101]GFE68873.1 DNA topoisomerase (ATP-hydrolyzing) [Chroococcus sp. FPU101]
MAKQLNILTRGQIIPTALHQEMERSYLEYAMSVIVGRALPDVRDGLKPVHRRILYAMYELGLTSDRPFRKCARVVGDVLGKYHPHGDQSVYEALVRMVQDFTTRYPLLSGHGNFGSVDNDPAAAMRYTETRLAAVADQAMLQGISEAIVDFTNNFDNSQQEPVVLPAQLPFLILNGCTGIAVGMATNVPPHNAGEIIDGLIALIDNSSLTDEALWKLIPGPDFPTGGEILDTEGIREAYRTGKGLIPLRGVTKIETLYIEAKRRKERTAIIITELPYQVNKSAWIEKVAELVNLGKIDGIADIRDESDRQGMRVVVELKREIEPKTILNALYQQTALQINFGAIFLALVNNQPRQLSLRQLLEEFLAFREETLRRQYSHELNEVQQRVHLLEGLLLALENLKTVIEILTNAADGTTAKQRFQAELGISEAQSDSILAMPLRRLTGLERQKLQTEYEELQKRIQELQTLLGDRHELLKTLKKDFRTLKRKFSDERRTRILPPTKETTTSSKKSVVEVEKDNKSQISSEKSEIKANKSKLIPETKNKSRISPEKSEIKDNKVSLKETSPKLEASLLTLFTPQTPPEEALICLTHQGEIYWKTPYNDQQHSEQPLIYTQSLQKREKLIVITDSGKAYPVAINEIPPKNSQPISVLTLLSRTAQQDSERAVSVFLMPDGQKSHDLLLLTESGRIKRIDAAELEQIGNRGLALTKLKEQDRLNYVCWTKEGEEVAIATTGGRVLRFAVTDEQIPIMGRNAQGNMALRLRFGETIVGCVTLQAQDNLLLVSQLGYGKRLPINTLRLIKLGELGTTALQFSSKSDNLAGMVKAKSKQPVIILTNQKRHLMIDSDSVVKGSKDGVGDRIVQLQTKESIVAVMSSQM